MMNITNISRVFAVLVVSLVLFGACESDEPLPQYKNPNQSDTSGNNIVYDLFVSAEVENVPSSYANGIAGYSNWTRSSELGYCDLDSLGFIQSHITSFEIPNTLTGKFSIDIRGCVNIDSLSDINKIDSVLVLGSYPYYPKFKNNRTVLLEYIDDDSVVWSSALGGNTSSYASFQLSAIVNNVYDNNSKKIGFGKFEGFLYDGQGDSLKIRNGQFKGRIVQ